MTRKEVFWRDAGKLFPCALAFWAVHALLRVLLLFRLDPYGQPFVNKPDWYVFHALSLDFLWIAQSLLLISVVAWALPPLSRWRRFLLPVFCFVHGVLLYVTLLDQEVQRFLGMHLTFTLLDTYKDVSSVRMFSDYVGMDQSIPYLQYVLLAIMPLLVFLCYTLLRRWMGHRNARPSWFVAGLAVYVVCWLFLYVIWSGGSRLRKLAPVVTVARQEWSTMRALAAGDTVGLGEDARLYQSEWLTVQGDSLWAFPDSRFPLWRIPLGGDVRDSVQRALKPNFIVIFLESQRGTDVGFLNAVPGEPSPTPFLDSLASAGTAWNRMHVSGLPTVGGLLSSHMGVVPHTRLNQVTQLAHIHAPSFASVLRDSGYTGHFFAAADPAWDNLGTWLSKWYQQVHYDRSREDDSTFWAFNARYLSDSLGASGKPFLAAMITRSNHYPFNFAPGMPDTEKAKPVEQRIRYTMNFADRHLGLFFRRMAREPWFAKTYVIVLADHGFPLGENGVTTMSGGAFYGATWIPLVIHGPGLQKGGLHSVTASQLDLAPTILGLAGIRTGVPYMGHDLLRGSGNGWAWGTHYQFGTYGDDRFRLLASLNGMYPDFLFRKEDSLQRHDFSADETVRFQQMRKQMNAVFRVSDHVLAKDRLFPLNETGTDSPR